MELVTRILKIIRNVIIIVFLFAVITAVLDYTRIISGLEPIFNISSYNSVTHIEKYRGLFYQASRKTKINNEEDLEDSFDINFYVLTIKIDVPNKSNEDNFEFYLKTSEVNECSESSKLYYADKDIKIYTYCIDSINVVELGQSKENTLLSYLKKDNKIIDDLIQNISFTGLYVDGSTEMYKTIDESFSNNGISLYKCNKPGINDIYIGPKGTDMQGDFCTYKDDDFKFISTISEELYNTTNYQKSSLYGQDYWAITDITLAYQIFNYYFNSPTSILPTGVGIVVKNDGDNSKLSFYLAYTSSDGQYTGYSYLTYYDLGITKNVVLDNYVNNL